jgi:Tfp pilus assembly PilM family ATPase/Tfp pilus assembly protein PilN
VGSKHVIIELRFQSFDVVVFERGQRTATRRLPMDMTPDPIEWAAGVRRAAPALRKTVEDLGLQGSKAIVLYRSPTQAVQLANLDMQSRSQAIDAAVLGCLDALPYSDMAAVCQATVVGKDVSDKGGRTHVLVAADRDDIAASIVHMVEESGLRVTSTTPIEAGILGKLAGDVLKRNEGRSGMLYIGEESSFFLIHENGNLLFDRRVGLSLEVLASALTRPIHLASDDKPIELDLATAYRILTEHGIPSGDQIIDDEHGLRGDQIIPLLQPVFERFMIQLRQSLRFDVPEDQRAHFPFVLSGPGSTLNGLAALLEVELGVQVTCDPRYSEFDVSEPGSNGSELMDAAERRSMLTRVNLLPLSLGHARRIAQLRRWLWAGVAAALVFVGFQSMDVSKQINEASAQSYDLERRMSEVQPLRDASSKVLQMTVAMGRLEQAIVENVGAKVPYGKVMQELGRLTPDNVRITGISSTHDEVRTVCTVAGYAFSGPDGSPMRLEAFVDRLRQSPLFTSVVLGTVQVGAIAGVEGQHFTVTFEPVAAVAGEVLEQEQLAHVEPSP